MEVLIVFLVLILARLLVDHFSQQRFDGVVSLVVRGVDINVAFSFHLIDLHGERTQVAHILQHEVGRLSWHGYSSVEHDANLRIGELLLCIAQFVHTLPTAPLTEGLADEFYLLLSRIVVHTIIARDGQFASFRQILILLQQFIDFLYCSIVAILLSSYDTGRFAVTCLGVEVVEHIEFIQFDTDDAQQVVTEEFAIHTLDDEGHVFVLFHLRQFGAEFICQLGFGHQSQRIVTVAYHVEHRLIDRLQYLVVGLIEALLHAHHFGLQ